MSVTGFNRRRRELARKAEEIDWEEKIEEYNTGGGWYKVPAHEKALRKEEAIKVLKEDDN